MLPRRFGVCQPLGYIIRAEIEVRPINDPVIEGVEDHISAEIVGAYPPRLSAPDA